MIIYNWTFYEFDTIFWCFSENFIEVMKFVGAAKEGDYIHFPLIITCNFSLQGNVKTLTEVFQQGIDVNLTVPRDL